jgi:hypothetical protein
VAALRNPQLKLCNLVASGAKDGSLLLVDISSGKVGIAAQRRQPGTTYARGPIVDAFVCMAV